MDKQFLKSLETPEEKAMYLRQVTKERKREWDKDNEMRVFAYRRKTFLKRCINNSTFPTSVCIQKYAFTEDELKPIFKSLWSSNFETGIEGIHC